jgi:thiol-disulfide isomerase/thioredoxin
MSVTAYHFWSPTCAPCKAIKGAVEDLTEDFNTVNWYSVNTHDDKNGIAESYNVTVVPTIVVETKNAEGNVILVEKQSGTTIAAYYRILRNGLRLIQQS